MRVFWSGRAFNLAFGPDLFKRLKMALEGCFSLIFGVLAVMLEAGKEAKKCHILKIQIHYKMSEWKLK